MTPTQTTARSRARLLRWGLPVLTAGILVAALVMHLMPPSTKETQAMLAERPSSEAIVTRYEQMRQDTIDRLDTELGEKGWQQSPNETVNGVAGCDGASTGGLIVFLTLFTFHGTYEGADRQRSLEIVREVAAEYGFTTEVAGGADDVEIFGHDDHDASLSFWMQNNTTFRITSGCHLPAARLND